MRSFLAINKRNIGLYFRDYSAVFFSLLSMIIIIVLMVFFLGDINNGDLLDAIKLVPKRGGDSDIKTIEQFSFLWTCAGILTINASTVTHAFFSNMIKDRTGNRINIASSANMERDMTSMSMNVDNFQEAYDFLISKGFVNPRGDKVTDTSSSKSTLLISPSGFPITISEHLK